MANEVWLIDAKKPFVLARDAELNKNDKSLRVGEAIPNGCYRILWVMIHGIATATAGTRVLRHEIYESRENLVFSLEADTIQGPAANEDIKFLWAALSQHELIVGPAGPPYQLHIYNWPVPVVLPGWRYRIFDRAGVDAADDFTISVMLEEVGK
jgi:hypothetical protein